MTSRLSQRRARAVTRRQVFVVQCGNVEGEQRLTQTVANMSRKAAVKTTCFINVKKEVVHFHAHVVRAVYLIYCANALPTVSLENNKAVNGV